jgi:hypothetical protein
MVSIALCTARRTKDAIAASVRNHFPTINISSIHGFSKTDKMMQSFLKSIHPDNITIIIPCNQQEVIEDKSINTIMQTDILTISTENFKCPVCLDLVAKSFPLASCCHRLCGICYSHIVSTHDYNSKCPICRAAMLRFQHNYYRRIVVQQFYNGFYYGIVSNLDYIYVDKNTGVVTIQYLIIFEDDDTCHMTEEELEESLLSVSDANKLSNDFINFLYKKCINT